MPSGRTPSTIAKRLAGMAPVLGLMLMFVGAAQAAPADPVSLARARTAAALPDWSGVFMRINPPGQPVAEPPSFTEKWKVVFAANVAKVRAATFTDPLNYCLPRGMPGVMMAMPDQYEFAVTPEQVWVFIENGEQVRRIYTDGRPQLSGPDLFPTYNGNSVGHWEGDTLVVHTVGLRDDMIIDRSGTTLSGDAVVTERMRMSGPDTIEDQLTIEDKTALTKPWLVTRSFGRQAPGSMVFDYACAENNRNPVDDQGKALVIGPDGKPIG